MRMWALSPETSGCACGLPDPVADALCTHPRLHALEPVALARELGVGVGEAQSAINKVASIASDGSPIPQGVSLDSCLSGVGHSTRPTSVLFSPDAGRIALHGAVKPHCGCDAGSLGLPGCVPNIFGPVR